MPARGWAPSGSRGLRAGAGKSVTSSEHAVDPKPTPWAPSKGTLVLRPAPSPARRLAGVALTSASLAVALVLPAGAGVGGTAPPSRRKTSATLRRRLAGTARSPRTAATWCRSAPPTPATPRTPSSGLHATGVGATAGDAGHRVPQDAADRRAAGRRRQRRPRPPRLLDHGRGRVRADPRHFGGHAAAQRPRRAAARDEPYVRPRQGPVRRGRPDVRRRVPSGCRPRRAQGRRRRRDQPRRDAGRRRG